jgi:hypothetical protein
VTELMSMRDIAGLAHVQRPVVSTWRRRSRAGSHPFPVARRSAAGQELFVRDEVVAWLEQTRRGNNPDVRSDAAAHSLLATSGASATVLSALLTLAHVAGSPLPATTDGLLDLAESFDPDDRYLFDELARAGDLAGPARTAEELVEADWNAAAAHARLVVARLRTPGSPLAQVCLAEPARRFLLGLLGPLAAELGGAAVMDATGCAVDVLAEVAAALAARAILLDGDRDGPAHRLTRRQLVLAGVPHSLVPRGDGDWSVTGPVAHLLVLPAADRPDADALAHLDLLEEVALQLDARQLVLCLAPAATLSDALVGEALVRRDELLRGGLVRAIVRLPAGLRPAQPREASGLWLLGAPDAAPAADRRTLVADLTDSTLGGCDGLADDLLAAWQGAAGARRRAWAHLHPAPTADLVSASGSLVPPRPPRVAAPARTGADWAVDLRAADTGRRLAGYRLDIAAGRPEAVTIGQGIERGLLRVLPGRRLDLAWLPAGSVPVWGPELPARPHRGVDRLALLTRGEAELTEPGDIVFVATPRPRAVLDAEGGALVLAPARVLRLRPGVPLVAAAVVARINALSPSGWRGWTLATVADPDREPLAAALAHLAAERARLSAELAGLDALTADLTTAVEHRQLTIAEENHGPSQG